MLRLSRRGHVERRLTVAALLAFAAVFCGLVVAGSTDAATALPKPGERLWSAAVGDLIWSADTEEGSLADWYYPETTSSGDYGGGVYDSGSGFSLASREQTHSGSWAVRATLATGSGGTRLFRWLEPRAHREAVYSAWFYIPTSYNLTADVCCGRYWNVFQFKSRSTSGAVDPFWYADLQNRPDGSLGIDIIWWLKGSISGPHEGEAGFRRYVTTATVPIGRWFKLSAFLRQSSGFDGTLRFYLDDQLFFGQANVRTSYSNCSFNQWCASNEWSVNNYSDGLVPIPPVVYIDDAAIRLP